MARLLLIALLVSCGHPAPATVANPAPVAPQKATTPSPVAPQKAAVILLAQPQITFAVMPEPMPLPPTRPPSKHKLDAVPDTTSIANGVRTTPSRGGPVVRCEAPTCTVLRDAARAPAVLADVAAAVDFSQSVLIVVTSDNAVGLDTYDGSWQSLNDGHVVEVPVGRCPYCGGAAPPANIDNQPPRTIVVRVPAVDGVVYFRTRSPGCSCDMRLP